MGSPINVRSLTGNPPYTGTIGNLMRSYSDLSISNVKNCRGKQEKEKGGRWGGERKRKGEIIR